mmetsp:Transcript_10360/g.28506  ORF Transcript_10360/g.28506 Transcript_10360/m.28506 type:complete len:91 (-) Transcript_10360:16-288(-)
MIRCCTDAVGMLTHARTQMLTSTNIHQLHSTFTRSSTSNFRNVQDDRHLRSRYCSMVSKKASARSMMGQRPACESQPRPTTTEERGHQHG